MVALAVAQLKTGAKGLGSYLVNDLEISITEPAVVVVALSFMVLTKLLQGAATMTDVSSNPGCGIRWLEKSPSSAINGANMKINLHFRERVNEKKVHLWTWCRGRPTMDGKTARGASSPAKPALHIPDPLSTTKAAESSSHILKLPLRVPPWRRLRHEWGRGCDVATSL